MKQDIYKIENSIEKVLNGKNTFFLYQNELKRVIQKLKKDNYKIYYPYKDSEKVILYFDTIPRVCLFKINSYEKIRHQDILGSILGLNISPNYLGDIIVDKENYYFYIFDGLKEYIKNNLTTIGRSSVILEEIDIDYLKDYERKYEEKNIIVSSLRIDNVLSKIIGTNREDILKKIKDKEVILNYDILVKPSYIIKENDIFSVRKFGKFKFISVVNYTKRNNYVILFLKYV